MPKRSEDWMAEFEHLLPKDEEIKALVLDGSIEICPCCNEMSAYAYQDTSAYDQFDTGESCIVPGVFKSAPGSIAGIGTCSGMGEWECGHCGRHIVEADSPLLSPCYTHSED